MNKDDVDMIMNALKQPSSIVQVWEHDAMALDELIKRVDGLANRNRRYQLPS